MRFCPVNLSLTISVPSGRNKAPSTPLSSSHAALRRQSLIHFHAIGLSAKAKPVRVNDTPKSSRSRVTLIIDIVEYDDRWLVRLHRNTYSEHRKKDDARGEALNLAVEARQLGHKVEVWDRSTGKRL
jgi:hypothetical protein